MNRIGGVFHLDGAPVARETLAHMAAELALPGQRLQSTEIHGNVGLVGVSTGRNPWADEPPPPVIRSTGGQLIAFEGRIDNQQDLLALLWSELSAGPRPTSIMEILLAGHQTWGEQLTERLIGDFAFAIWDPVGKTLVCARDHFGTKPFYFYATEQRFIFASTPDAVLASGEVPVQINDGRIADLLIEPWPSFDCLDKTSSFYAGVFRLEPAHMLTVHDRRVDKRRYWRPNPPVEPSASTDKELLENFRQLLTDAVRCRLPGGSKPASMLSGGLDTSSIVAIARKILSDEGTEPLHTFSAVSPLTRPDGDVEHIAAVLAQGGCQPHLVSEAELAPRLDELMDLLSAEREPFEWLANMERALYMAARESGIEGLMDGVDGDSLLLRPYAVRAWLWRQGYLGAAIGETIGACGVEAWAYPNWTLFVESLRAALAPDWVHTLSRARRHAGAVGWAVQHTIINRDFAVRSRLGQRWATLDANASPMGHPNPAQAHAIALDHPGITSRLERVERVASALGLEMLHPLLDVRLVQFCLSLPWQLQTHRGWTKLMMRRAVEPLLPSNVVWRKTRDALGRAFNIYILQERGQQLFQLVMDGQRSLKDYIDFEKLLRLWREYSANRTEDHEVQIWHAIALAMWLRKHKTRH